MDPALRLQPGQQALTPTQEAEARRFAEESIQRHLSTEPVDEQEVEAFLRQAYQAAGLDPPQRIHWLDGPLQLVAVLAPSSMGASVLDRVGGSVGESVEASVGASVGDSVRASVAASVGDSVRASVQAYANASWLACYQFFDAYLAPNALHALAHFNERVSGYWLGQDTAVLVRRSARLARDSLGRWHSATGKCLEYRDGWGFYAWQGVRVPEPVILEPDRLTREDFLTASNVEVRRVIQERMGQRFVPELGGIVLDTSPRGTLYEVRLPGDDPERVARYVQVQDASSERPYFLRVPPTVQTAAAAVAWSFGLSGEDYHPAQET
jgi:hypothetical protein